MLEAVVIGAGPGGIACTKELLENGVDDVVCLEQSRSLGGVFVTGYDDLLLTSSVPFSMFSDFWVGDGKGHHFWSKEEAVAYWQAYADNYGVTPRIRFDAKVAAVSQGKGGHWEVTLESGEVIQTRQLALATGNNSVPRFPGGAMRSRKSGFIIRRTTRTPLHSRASVSSSAAAASQRRMSRCRSPRSPPSAG